MSSFLAHRRLGVLLAALACAPAVLRAQQPSFPFQDRTLPIDKRIDDLVSRMTLEEKASQHGQPHARHPPARRARVQHLVRGAPRRRRRRLRHGVPAGDRAGGHLRRADASRDGASHGPRGPRQVQPGRARRACRAHDGRPDVLLAEHQHLPRPALGPRPGDLRRGSLPLRPPRGRLHHRHAGRRPRPSGRDGHGQALRRALRPRAPAARLRRQGLGARHRGHLPPRLSRGGRRGQGEVGDVRVQRRQRRARVRQRVPARRHAARAVEVPGLRHRATATPCATSRPATSTRSPPPRPGPSRSRPAWTATARPAACSTREAPPTTSATSTRRSRDC